jgi:site-specific DNA-methyltransferase (adenine-specific)
VFRTGSTQFTLCTEDTYKRIAQIYGIDKMEEFKDYQTLSAIDKDYREALITRMNKENPSVFNLWQGVKSKSNVLEYAKDSGSFHPTQKPVLLLEDLIKTFSNVGNTVLDFTMGSGSTGVACMNTGRKFIGIELDKQYFEIACKRIDDHKSQVRMVF